MITLALSILTRFDIQVDFSKMLGDFIAGSPRKVNYSEMF